MSIRLRDIKEGSVKHGVFTVTYEEFQYNPDGSHVLVDLGNKMYRYATISRTVPIWAFARAR